MHEFSVANHAVAKILEIAREKGAKRICGVEFLMGELCMVGSEQLTFWIKEILSSRVDIANDIKIELRPVKEGRDCILNRVQLEI